MAGVPERVCMLQPGLSTGLIIIMRVQREYTEPKHMDIKDHSVTSEQRIAEMAFANREHPHHPIIHSVPDLSPYLAFSYTLYLLLSLTRTYTWSRGSQETRSGLDDLKLKWVSSVLLTVQRRLKKVVASKLPKCLTCGFSDLLEILRWGSYAWDQCICTHVFDWICIVLGLGSRWKGRLFPISLIPHFI